MPAEYQQVLKDLGKQGGFQGERPEDQHPEERPECNGRWRRNAHALRFRRLAGRPTGSATLKTTGSACRCYVLRRSWDWGLPPFLAYSHGIGSPRRTLFITENGECGWGMHRSFHVCSCPQRSLPSPLNRGPSLHLRQSLGAVEDISNHPQLLLSFRA
jgi:hypothetical protein